MLKDVPDDATILIHHIEVDGYWTWEPVTCYVLNPNNTVELYSGDTDND